MKTKTCSTCKETKSHEEFGRMSRNPDGLLFECRECSRKRQHAWASSDKGRKSNADTQRQCNAAQKRLETTPYFALLYQQGNKCGLCEKPREGKEPRFSIFHGGVFHSAGWKGLEGCPDCHPEVLVCRDCCVFAQQITNTHDAQLAVLPAILRLLHEAERDALVTA